MRIERVNDNQIRCTLSKQDLSERHLKLSEIAYGSDKAKDLLRDMMQQASTDFGFETDEVPLMIEAIPVSNESIVLLITKVDDPDEFEEKFSKFSPAIDMELDDLDHSDEDFDLDISDDLSEMNDELEDVDYDSKEDASKDATFVPLHEAIGDIKKRRALKEKKPEPLPVNQVLFRFMNLDEIIDVSKRTVNVFYGKSFVWKEKNRTTPYGKYYLLLRRGTHPEDEFKVIADTISDYGEPIDYSYQFEAYLKEYCIPVVKKNAIQVLSVM